ncbi:hypothetical protein THF1A12_70167 [Vibrio jasicida]|uniref:DUF4282 domain-containing protein n=1 Tax=Vibrio jasicida TaxID=766224 RepID=A0AAU9QYD5_9VIBR|nr:hypothetical protein THF1A12_70167 [Vibrio jasicida]
MDLYVDFVLDASLKNFLILIVWLVIPFLVLLAVRVFINVWFVSVCKAFLVGKSVNRVGCTLQIGRYTSSVL